MGKDSSEIRREIEETRARMGDTVEALSYKTDVPARMKDAVNDRVETVKGTISEVVEGVKDTVMGATGKVGSALGGAKRGVNDTLSGTTETMGDATSTVTSSLHNAVGNMTHKLGNVTDKVGDVAHKIPSADDVKTVARRGAGLAAENPLGLALGALAVGFLAGLAAPVTDIERKTVGPIRDDLVDRAKSMGSDVIEHGKQVLQETAATALQTAQQSAQQHSQQVLGEAKGDAAQGEASGQTSSQYGVLLDEAGAREPGKPGTMSS
ncbi:MAG: hypothetical protein NVS4B13_04960 [Candidatus Elarobacter sp.]